MNNTWTINPSDEWRDLNREWLLEANLPGTERCEATLTGLRCELRADHTCSHVVSAPDLSPEA